MLAGTLTFSVIKSAFARPARSEFFSVLQFNTKLIIEIFHFGNTGFALQDFRELLTRHRENSARCGSVRLRRYRNKNDPLKKKSIKRSLQRSRQFTLRCRHTAECKILSFFQSRPSNFRSVAMESASIAASQTNKVLPLPRRKIRSFYHCRLLPAESVGSASVPREKRTSHCGFRPCQRTQHCDAARPHTADHS